VIVVIGSAACRAVAAGPPRVAGLAAEIAASAAEAGAHVELLARIGDDLAGEELLLALARAGVGHLAVLRDPARPTAVIGGEPETPEVEVEEIGAALLEEAPPEAAGPAAAAGGPAPPELEPADLSLGLRYLREFDVVVAVEPLPPGGAAVIADAASFADATLVVILPPGTTVPPAYAAATLLEAPDDDPDGAFARLVGRYAAALDGGVAPAEAFRAATAEGGWEVAAG
jgi:sugar/nucleoside kinase (ribokinase family)